MVRRPAVKRYPNGIPLEEHRCKALVVVKDELFSRQCKKARLRGMAFCEIHRDTARLEVLRGKVAASYTDVVDNAAADTVGSLSRLMEVSNGFRTVPRRT